MRVPGEVFLESPLSLSQAARLLRVVVVIMAVVVWIDWG